MRWRDADEDEWRDDDESEGDVESDETDACPHCFHPVYDDAERCPFCGTYLSREDSPGRRPWWLVVGVLVGLVVVIGWVVG